jgi:hypothetical protein
MRATYNTQTKELIVKGDDIQDFQTIIETDEQDYWDTVKGKDEQPLYDINLFDYGDNFHLQYVNLVDDNEGGLQCSDNYQLANLTVLI